jgi:hypothetical protein
MQRLHGFYVRWGKLPFMGLLFLTIMASLFMDQHGWSRTAVDIVFVALAICIVGSLYYFVNLWKLRNWHCPRCGTRWPGGWSEKAAQCSGCDLHLSSST